MSSLARKFKRSKERSEQPDKEKSKVPPMRVRPTDEPILMAVMYAYLDYKMDMDVPLFLGAWPRARQLHFWEIYEHMRSFDWDSVQTSNARKFAQSHHALMLQKHAGLRR